MSSAQKYATKEKDIETAKMYMIRNGYSSLLRVSMKYSNIFGTAPVCGESFYDSMENINDHCKKLQINNYDPHVFKNIVLEAKNLLDKYWGELGHYLINSKKIPNALSNIILSYLKIEN